LARLANTRARSGGTIKQNGKIDHMEATESLAQFVSGFDASALPEEALRRAKTAMLDCVGVAVAGARFESSLIVLDYIRECGGAPQATVLGTDIRTSAADAALANGHLSSSLLYEDTCLIVPGHATATLLPVLLALGESRHLSGRALLEAYVVGFEVEAALGPAIDPEHYERGWHATSTVGTMGATAAACRLLGLDRDTVRMALGIAASLASGFRQNFGTMMQAFHSGMAARNGVMAALLAQRGFTADPTILESRMGYANLFGAGPEKLVPKIAALGKDLALLGPNLYLKLYPCGFPLQRPIDLAIDLATAHDLDPDQIESIRCGVHYLIPETVFHENPQTGLQGRTSISYCIARAIIDRRMGLAQFTDAKVQESDVRKLMAKVRTEVPPELSRETLRGRVNAIAAPAVMQITLKDGRVLDMRLEHYRGAPERPLTRDEVVQKYRDYATMVLEAAQVECARQMIENLERVEDTAQLAVTLAAR
jgi:2-methylcitrate dehydratase PrpD